MPQLVFKGMTVDQVKKITTPLVQELAVLCKCDMDNFTFEIIHTTFIFDQEEVPGFPFVEVKWFDRGQEIQDEFAKIMTKHIHSLDIIDVEIAFTVFLESAYYLNGKNFG
jgi:hypothetical protein